MKVSGAIFSAAWINSTALLLPKKRWPLQYNCATASKKRWKPLPRSGENRFQEAVRWKSEDLCKWAALQRWCSGIPLHPKRLVEAVLQRFKYLN